MNTSSTTPVAKVRFRPQFALYHPNPRGTGSAVKMDIRPALTDSEGCVMLSIATQATLADRSAGAAKAATFDWANALTVKLGFSDLCAFLQVFRGEYEAIEGGKGLFHMSSAGSTKINLKHMIESCVGYSLDISRTSADGAERHARFFFDGGEALGLSEALCGIMSVICFGVPGPSWESARSPIGTKGSGNEAA